MVELRFTADINADADDVFSLLADLRAYDRWLPRSTAFYGTTRISDGPIAVGTTYVEDSPFGVRQGIVTDLVRPVLLNFEQPMTLKPRILGAIGIKLSHVLNPKPGSVHLLRRLELDPRGPVALLMPWVAAAFRSENKRMIERLKMAAERQR